ncbi:MAG TPA: trehalose-phosphatase [Candidatus Eisenbacteria bacterium]|nr:trehalose-phosphatase [Candidatus Eisenbacteria bacterium]
MSRDRGVTRGPRFLFARDVWGDAAEGLARSGRSALVAMDIDGTIAGIVARPEEVRVSGTILRAIRSLARRGSRGPRLALVTARPSRDVKRLLPVKGVLHVPQYGLEGFLGPPASERTRWRRAAREVARLLEPVEERIPGAWIERKSMTVALHDRRVTARHVPELRRRLQRATREARALGFEPARGKRVTDFVPRGYDKGKAVRLLRRRLDPSMIVYFGDSEADEPAFAALRAGDVPVRVGTGPTRARYRVRGPADVARFFRELARLAQDREREPGGTS